MKENDAVSIIPIENRHQNAVRELYRASYSQVMQEFPSVGKMVKTALKSNLSDTPVKKEVCTEGISPIRARYNQRYKRNKDFLGQ